MTFENLPFMISVLSLLVSGANVSYCTLLCMCLFCFTFPFRLVPVNSEDMTLTMSFNMIPSSGVPEDGSEEDCFLTLL